MKKSVQKLFSKGRTAVNQLLGRSTDKLLVTESDPFLEWESVKRCCCIVDDGPDSPWSWFIAYVNFVINFIMVGLGRMSGILYIEFMDHFKINRMTAALPFSIQTAGRNLFGPLTGILGQKYGLQFVTIVGGLVGSLSAATLYYKLDVTTSIVAWGVFFGLGTALTTTLSQVSIDQHFEQNRATAGGFAISGGCVGGLVLPLILEHLLHVYDMSGTFLVLAAFVLLVVPAGMMLGKPSWSKHRALPSRPSLYGSLDDDDSYASEDYVKEVVAGTGDSGHSYVSFRCLRENSEMVFKFLTMDAGGGQRPGGGEFREFDKPRLLNEMEAVYATVLREMQGDPPGNSKDAAAAAADDVSGLLKVTDDAPRKVFIRNRLKELGQFRGMNLVARFPYWEQSTAWNVLIELRKLHEIISDQSFAQRAQDFRMPKPKAVPGSKKNGRSNSFCSHMRTALGLHANPVFLLICMCRAVFTVTFTPVVFVIVDYAMDVGLPRSDGQYAISVLSVGDLVGRLCMGWVTDCGCLSLPRYMLLGMLGLAASSASLPFLTARASFLAGVFVFAVLQGSLYVRHPILVSKYLEPHEQAIGMGFINLLSGVLSFGVPLFIGYFRDQLGSYDKMFYVNGIICAAVGLIWILEPLFLMVCSANHNEKKKKSVT